MYGAYTNTYVDAYTVELVVRLTSFLGTCGTVLCLMLVCLPGSLGLGIIQLDFVLAVVCSTSRLLSTTPCLWDSVLLAGLFWGFLSTEGLSTDTSKTLHISDL